MYSSSNTAIMQYAPAHCPEGLAVRSYQEIAQVLMEREGVPVSPSQVRRLCRGAERKIYFAARADPLIFELLNRIAAQNSFFGPASSVTALRTPINRPFSKGSFNDRSKKPGTP